jgi:hypothetical protein
LGNPNSNSSGALGKYIDKNAVIVFPGNLPLIESRTVSV